MDAAAQRSNYDYYYYGQQQQNQHPDYSYSQQDGYDVPVEDKKCYLCEYTFLASENHEEGTRDCMDPFSGVGVHQRECSEPCTVCYNYSVYLHCVHKK